MKGFNQSKIYTLLGVSLGVCAPLGWILLRLLLFFDTSEPLLLQLLKGITASPESRAMCIYMGFGTSFVLGVVGYLIGRNSDELRRKATELDEIRKGVESQKELFENRYKVLNSNIENFHQIGGRIQSSLNLEEVLLLSAEGLHDIMGYERVNILMVANNRRELRFVTATGSEMGSLDGLSLPIEPSTGVFYKSIMECKPYLVEDISRYSDDYYLKPPHDRIELIRSRNFIVCPIVVKGEALGVFAIDNKFTRRNLNESDLDTIMLFADQVQTAITRINLLASVNTLTSELDSSFDFIQSHREQFFKNISTLIDSIESVTDGAAVIASASQGTMSSVDETSTAVNEISVAIEEVSKNLDTLAGIVHQSASAMEEITCTIANVERSAAISHEISSQVKEETSEGLNAVNETIDSLAEIQRSVEESYAGITRLAENSNRIENIVSVINDITKRTNLLALNASIIAAQAGEHGRSFGVVADEIRNLSLQTGHSTGEITSIIEEIMSESRQAAGNITSTKSLVHRGVEIGHAMGETLKAIYDRSVCSMDMTQEIKQATEEQSSSVQMVARSMEDISDMTSQIFNASKDQAKATRSIARSVENIKEMAHEMVQFTTCQVDDGHQIRKTVESVGSMVNDMFENIESRKRQASEVVAEMESLKGLTCQI